MIDDINHVFFITWNQNSAKALGDSSGMAILAIIRSKLFGLELKSNKASEGKYVAVYRLDREV